MTCLISYEELKEEHEVHLKLVLELLRKEKLYAKFSKCEFGRKSGMLGTVETMGDALGRKESEIKTSKRNDLWHPKDRLQARERTRGKATWFRSTYGKKRRREFILYGSNLEPAEIIDREVKSLKRSRIPIVKVHWNLKRGHEDFIKSKYPHLLVEQAIVRSTK
ncbi:hypothetical protein Tco_0152845 [Tanacetum coccineum]